MPKLIIYKDSKVHKELLFSNVISIGKNKSNDVVLRDPEVSRFHASIIQDARGDYILCDQASRNFTRVGGERVQNYHLSHGATFQIVNYLFVFLKDSDAKEIEQKVRLSRKISLKEKWNQDSKTAFTLDEMIGDKPKAYNDPHKRLSILLSFSSEMVSILDYNELIEKVLVISTEIMDAQRGFLALKNDRGTLIYSGLKGFDTKKSNLRVSETMIRKVVDEGRSILTANAVMEDTFRKAKSVLAYQIKSVMCVPLKVREEVMGCIYLDNPGKTASFAHDDLEFLTILARQIAVAIENARLRQKIEYEKVALKNRLRLQEEVIAKSEKMVRLYQDVQRVAKSNIPVLILGETGTGKELVARAIHNFSGRDGEFIALNCSAIPENLLESELFGYEKGAFTGAAISKPGMFELARGGTIFLDEIGDTSPSIQPKLLRVLQDMRVTRLGGVKTTEVDVRVVSATNKDLKAMMKNGDFRQDLYYRLAGVVLNTHSLRERNEDIPPLANYLLLKFSEENNRNVSRISHKAMRMLMAYDWPGNINELKNVIQRASLFGDCEIINPEDLPEELQKMEKAALGSFPSMEEIEKIHLLKALKRANGNKKKAAELLRIARDTMYKKIEKYGIDLKKPNAP